MITEGWTEVFSQCSAAVIKKLIKDIIKNDIRYFLLNPDSIKKYILNKSKKSLNNDFKPIEFENKKDKIKIHQ